MNKKLIFVLSLTLVVFTAFAQDKEEETPIKKGFQKDKLFTGGSIDASIANNTTGVGLAPFFGYSVIRWLDVAASFNFSYISQRSYYTRDKARQTILGPGVLVRAFPIKSIFLQAQYEHNFIRQKYIYETGGSDISKFEANSLLVGAGYASNRSSENDPYYFVSVMFDALSSPYSPYRDNLGRVVPIYRAGVVFPLFQGNGKKRH